MVILFVSFITPEWVDCDNATENNSSDLLVTDQNNQHLSFSYSLVLTNFTRIYYVPLSLQYMKWLSMPTGQGQGCSFEHEHQEQLNYFQITHPTRTVTHCKPVRF